VFQILLESEVHNQQSLKGQFPTVEGTDDYESVDVCVPNFITHSSVTENNREPSSGLSRRQHAQRQRRDREKIKTNGKCSKERRLRSVRISALDLLYVDLQRFQILPTNGHCDGNPRQQHDVQRDEAQSPVIHNVI